MDQIEKKQQYVLITSSNFPEGGASATYLNLFCRGLKINSFSVKVLLLRGFSFGHQIKINSRKNVTKEGVSFTYLSSPERPSNLVMKIANDIISIGKLIIFLFSILSERKSTTLLIYNNELIANIPIYLIGRLLRIKIVTFVPEFYDRSVFNGSILRKLKWYGFLFNFSHLNMLSSKLIVFSYFLKGEYIARGFRESDIIVQPNLTDFDYWVKENSLTKYTIGYSGNPSVKDGLHDLFKAISLLKKQNITVSLLVIGDSPFGRSRLPELERECSELNIRNEVTFTGLVETSLVKEYLSECGILAITRPRIVQTQAGFPTKLGEYFASMKPVLATDFGDIEKYFTNGVDLIIAESGNPESIKLKIKWMIENKKEVEHISQNGYKTAVKLLEFKNNVKKIIDFID